jgi:hypothetical protein
MPARYRHWSLESFRNQSGPLGGDCGFLIFDFRLGISEVAFLGGD